MKKMNRKGKLNKKSEPYIYYLPSTGNYKVQIDRKGMKIKSKTFRSLIEARRYRDNCLKDIANNSTSLIAPNKVETFSQTLNLYLEEVSDKRPSHESRKNERRIGVRIHKAEPELVAKITSQITAKDIDNYIDKRLESGAKPNTIHREMTFWKGVFTYSFERLNLSCNPVSKANRKRLNFNDARDVRITDAEKKRLLDECRYNSKNKVLASIIEFYFESGMRRGEALSLRFNDISYTDDGYSIANVKNRKNSRNPYVKLHTDIPLTKRATAIIKKLYNGNDEQFIFQITEDALVSAYKRARKRAGLSHFRIHDMRHDRASTLAKMGLNPLQIKPVTGHKDIRSLARYVNITPSETLETFRKLSI